MSSHPVKTRGSPADAALSHSEPSRPEQPTTVNTVPPQAATAPGSRSEVPADQIRSPEEVNRDDPNIRVVELPPQRKPSFKEQVFGYARVIRGKTLGNADVKEQGERVLRGEEAIPKRRGSLSE